MDEQDAAAAASTSSSSGSSSRILKFLTHKLRTHSLNEEPNQDKADDDHDSGTESDDEFQNGGDIADELSTAMDSLEEARAARDSAVPSDADLGASPPSTTATPFGFNSSSGCSSTETPPIEPPPTYDFLLRLGHSGDQHSSEEELEVINGPKDEETVTTTVTPLPVRPSAVPEKRKWSEANSNSCTQVRQRDDDGEGTSGGVTAFSAPASTTGREASGSSDEEIQGLCYNRSGSAISQPVQFRSSPPQDAHRPVRSLSPPPKLFHASSAFSSSPPCIASSSSSASEHLHHLHRPSHHHRPRSRPRPHSHYEHPHPHPHPHSHQQQQQHHHHHHHHRPHIAQDLADVDVVSACSPRKRHRPPRPCLDFEKMQQQLETQAVTAWRHTSEHSNELSVFCW